MSSSSCPMKLENESLNGIDNFETLLTTKEIFSLEDIYFGVKGLENGKAKDIEGYHA